MKKNGIIIVFILILSFVLASCEDSEELKNLKKHTADIRQKISNEFKQQNKTVLKLPTPVTYHAMTSSPTDQSDSAKQNEKKFVNPLNAYPAKAYQFTGTLAQGSQVWAYLLGPNNTIYQVKEGDVIGNNYGKIVKISDSQVEVLEKSKDANKPDKDKIIVLQLKD